MQKKKCFKCGGGGKCYNGIAQDGPCHLCNGTGLLDVYSHNVENKNEAKKMNKLRKAWKVSKAIHKNQKRYSGKPCINHIKDVLRVLDEMEMSNPATDILAILHDVLEDGGAAKDVAFLSLTEYDNLILLTHTPSRTYDEYIDEIINSEEKDVIAVKVADMVQNLTEEPKAKQQQKYRVALPKLIRALVETK